MHNNGMKGVSVTLTVNKRRNCYVIAIWFLMAQLQQTLTLPIVFIKDMKIYSPLIMQGKKLTSIIPFLGAWIAKHKE